MSKRGFIPGDNWVLCDRCGIDYRRSDCQKEWTGLLVCRECWDPRPIYRTTPSDKIVVNDPRPDQPHVFIEIGDVKPGDL